MLPVPRRDVLHAVEGRERAAAVPGITGLTIAVPVGARMLPPAGRGPYPGFIFTEADTRHDVEQAPVAACGRHRVVIG